MPYKEAVGMELSDKDLILFGARARYNTLMTEAEELRARFGDALGGFSARKNGATRRW